MNRAQVDVRPQRHRRRLRARRWRPRSQFRRAVQQWWTDGWDLLLTPTLAEPPLPLGTFANDAEHPMTPMLPRRGGSCRSPRRSTPAASRRSACRCTGPTPACPIGVQLVAAYGREDVLLRVAAQLEAAQPWAHRHPPV